MARNTNPPAATVKLVRERDQHRCARCGRAGAFGVLPLTTQHRAGRGMGGTRMAWVNEPANLLTLCGSGTTGCHGWVEANPREAKALGLATSRAGLRPDQVPVQTWRGLLLLTNTGEAIPMAEPPF